MLSCREATRLASESLDRRLSWRERLRLRMHFFLCEACTIARRRMLFLRQAARRFQQRESDDVPTVVRLSETARVRIQHALDERIP